MSSSSTPKVWFITGCSSGFGTTLAKEILSRGDKVIASARSISKLEDLKNSGADVIQLDVTAPLEDLKKTAQKAIDIHGRVDYLINNAGYLLSGTIEELTPEETFDQFNTNVFGLLNVTRAFLPFLRAAKSGVIANISSVGGWSGVPGAGVYCSSKWAVSGISESMTPELAELGIKVCCIEPGYFRSNLLKEGNRKIETSRIDDYDGTAARKVVERLDTVNGKQPGDLKKGARVMVDVLSGKDGRDVPARLVLGSDSYSTIKQKCEDTLKHIEQWKDYSCSTDHDDVVQK